MAYSCRDRMIASDASCRYASVWEESSHTNGWIWETISNYRTKLRHQDTCTNVPFYCFVKLLFPFLRHVDVSLWGPVCSLFCGVVLFSCCFFWLALFDFGLLPNFFDFMSRWFKDDAIACMCVDSIFQRRQKNPSVLNEHPIYTSLRCQQWYVYAWHF